MRVGRVGDIVGRVGASGTSWCEWNDLVPGVHIGASGAN